MALQDVITNLGTAIINLVDRKILMHCDDIEVVLLDLKTKIDELVGEVPEEPGISETVTQELLSITDALTSDIITSVNCTVTRGYKDGKSYCDYVFTTPINLASTEGPGSGLYRYSGHLFTPNIESDKQVFYASNDSSTYVKSEEEGYMAITTSVPTKVNYGSKGLMSAQYLWEIYTEATTDLYTEITLEAVYQNNVGSSN